MKGRGILAIAVCALIGSSSWAQLPNKCQGAKVKDAGKKAACLAGLQAKVLGAGSALDSEKVAKCEAKVGAAYAKLESKPGCNTSGDAGDIEAKVDAFVNDLVAELGTAPLPNKCQGAKIKDAGKKAACLAGLRAKIVGGGGSLDPAKVTKCEAKVGAAYAKLESKPGCNTTGDAGTIEGKVDSFVDDVVAELSATPAVCGNNTVDAPTETCDDGNAVDERTVDTLPPDPCPSNCRIEPCTSTSTTFSVSVNFSSTASVGGYKIFVDYPEGKVIIPGSGQPAAGVITNDPTASATANDLDYGLIVVSSALNPIPPSRLFTINFTACTGPAPAAGEFFCKVHQASDTSGNDIPMTCSVSIP